MGILDSMFGGGTKLDLKLDTLKIPEGGTLAGTVTLSGGKKPLKLTALKVRLTYLKVTPVEGQPLPRIEVHNLLDNTVIANQELPPASLQRYDFSFPVPAGTDPEGTYKVVATADIPGVKDPSADAELKIISPQSEGANPGLFGGLFKGKPSEDDILAQFPALMSRDEDELYQGLNDLLCAAYDADNNFVNIAPFLVGKMQQGPLRIRAQALATWANVLNNRAQPEHIRALEVLARDAELPEELMHEVVVAAAKFAEEGALPLVQQLARHPQPEVRKQMATRLWMDADERMPGRKELLLSMRDDADAGVRAAVFRAFTAFNSDRALMESLAQRASQDASPDVQQACIAALCLAHHHGMADLVFATFLAHAHSPHPQVGRELAECAHWLPQDSRLDALVRALLSSPHVEVRRAMAWQSCNMGEHPELAPLFLAALQDADAEVRGDVLGGLDKLLPLPEALALASRQLADHPSEPIAWGAYNLAKFQLEDPGARALMARLAESPFARVARRAREVLQ